MSEPAVSEYSHDHVILLLDTPDFENPPAWLSDNFNIIEGGTHAGKPKNKDWVLACSTEPKTLRCSFVSARTVLGLFSHSSITPTSIEAAIAFGEGNSDSLLVRRQAARRETNSSSSPTARTLNC
jgi:hypothetical protein